MSLAPDLASRGMLSVSGFCAWAGIGRTKLYAELAAGRLEAVKVGTKTLIPMDSAETWRAALPRVSFNKQNPARC